MAYEFLRSHVSFSPIYGRYEIDYTNGNLKKKIIGHQADLQLRRTVKLPHDGYISADEEKIVKQHLIECMTHDLQTMLDLDDEDMRKVELLKGIPVDDIIIGFLLKYKQLPWEKELNEDHQL